jgi:hypothetical protein
MIQITHTDWEIIPRPRQNMLLHDIKVVVCCVISATRIMRPTVFRLKKFRNIHSTKCCAIFLNLHNLEKEYGFFQQDGVNCPHSQ